MAKSSTLNRSALLKQVSERTGMARKEVEQVYEHTLRTIQDAVKKGEKVALTGFGRFTQRVQAARKAGMGKNPFTGETIKIAARPERRLPRFSPAKQFKEYVSGQAKLPALQAAKPAAKKPAAKKAAKKAPAKRKK
ncbi:MAG: HU family DNA-binding protein [Actinomycetota bacterium]